MTTATYPGERELYEHDVVPRLEQLDAAIRTLGEAAAAEQGGGDGRFVKAMWQVDAAAKRLDAPVGALAELVRANIASVVTTIGQSRERNVRLGLLFAATAVMVAIAALAIALRVGRRLFTAENLKLELETERAGELDLVAQRVAHDLLSPMATVALSLTTIQRAHPDEVTKHAAERAWRALDRSRSMVHGIYAFCTAGARPLPGAKAALRASVEQAVDDLVGDGGGEFAPTIDVQPFDEVEVAMDGALLGVVISNLLSNAVKYTKDSPVQHIVVRAEARGERVHVEVEDSGPGVPPGMEQAIFEPYRRGRATGQPGLGLGLATVKRLLLAHGGEVGVRRAPSGGAVFWFELPRARRVATEAPSPRAEQANGLPTAVH